MSKIRNHILKSYVLKGGFLLIFLGLGLTLPLVLSPYAVNVLTRILIYSILALSFTFLIGQANMISLAQVGFFGIAGYFVAILGANYGLAAPYLFILGIIVPVAVAAVFGLIALRATGIYFLMITLAFSQIVWSLADQWVSVTNGNTGIRSIPPIQLGGISFSASTSPLMFYFLVLVCFILCFGLILTIMRSSYGLALRSMGEDPERVSALGFSVFWLRYTAFLLGASLASIAGILSLYFDGVINPSSINLGRTVWILMVSILGGIQTIIGPLVGSATGMLLEQFTEPLTERYMIVVGSVFVFVVIAMPEGITGYLRRTKLFNSLIELFGLRKRNL